MNEKNLVNIHRGIMFERDIINQLNKICKDNGKQFIFEYRYNDISYDGFAPDGINDNIPTYVEIKLFSSGQINNVVFGNILKQARNVRSGKYLLIVGKRKQEIIDKLDRHYEINKGDKRPNIEIWDERQLFSELNSEPDLINMNRINKKSELIFSYIECYRNIRNTPVNYSLRFNVTYENNQIKVIKNNQYSPYPGFITNISAIVGKNGAGKTNLCEYITGHIDEATAFFNVYYSDEKYIIVGNVDPFFQKKNEGETKEIFTYECKLLSDYLVASAKNVTIDIVTIFYKNNYTKQTDILEPRNAKIRNIDIYKSDISVKFKMEFLVNTRKKTYDNLFKKSKYQLIVEFPDYKLEHKNFNIPDHKRDHVQTSIFYLLISILKKKFEGNQEYFKEELNRVIERYYAYHASLNDAFYMLDNFFNHQIKHNDKVVKQLSRVLELIELCNLTISKNRITIEIDNNIPDSELANKMMLIDVLSDINDQYGNIFFHIPFLTDGENCVLHLFSGLFNKLKSENRDNIILVLDEPETSMHPEFSRRFVDILFDFLKEFDKTLQIIISTHSPFILSDIISGNVLYLENNEKFIANNANKNTFAANINELLIPTLFMDNTIGEFAHKIIMKIVDYIDKTRKKIDYWDVDRHNECENLVNLISDGILKKIILKELKDIKKGQEQYD